MLPRADLDATRLPATLEAPASLVSSVGSRVEAVNRLMQITLGQHLQAEVLSLLNEREGTYLVRVADTTARMALPAGTKAGDALSLVFVAKEPRPTFLLTSPQGSTTASLSTAGRLIDNLLQQAQGQDTSPMVQAKSPLLPAPATATALQAEQVAATLHDTVEFSGLFYEAHMHEWISGGRPLTDLSHEPQAQFQHPSPKNQAQVQHGPDQSGLAKAAIKTSATESGNTAWPGFLRETSSSQPASLSPTDAIVITQQEQPLPRIEPEAARIISQQLNTLEHQQFSWRGELWPGQPMEWEVTRDPAQGNAQEGPEPSWSSVVRFQLPTLGDISATVRLVGERLHIQVNTHSETTASALRAHSTSLSNALAAAGSPLESLLVKQNESS